MAVKDPKNLWLEPLVDVSKPYLYVVILPPLILFALGQRRAAVMYFIGAAAVMTFLAWN